MKSKLRMRNKFFSVGMILFLMFFIIACGSSNDSPSPVYSISGAVSGAILNGVTINMTGAATTSATTDASGNFSFTGGTNGTFTLTPVKAGYTFNPASLVVVVSGASVTNANFVATATSASTYSISGTVSGAVQAGVMITLSGSTTGTTITNTSGNYSFSGLVNGSYTVTPSMTGFTFSPANSAANVSGANVTVPNFVATAIPAATYSMSGAVSGATLAGVTINLTGAATTSTTTDAGGNFSITGLANGAYTVTPVKTGYTFTPTSSAVNVSGVNITGTNFVAVANPALTYTISGTVSGAVLSGVTITLSGAGSASTATNASGNYSFSGIVDGSYTVTPSMTGYTFSPANSAANVSGANITGTNFIATAIPATYTQADLTGTWNLQMLETGSSNKWMRSTATVDSSGLLTLSSCLQSTGNTICPPAGTMQWTINTSGVISESGVNGGDQVHMTMTSNKNFIAGTGQSSSGRQLRIIQKMVPGTVYTNADVQNKSFVVHGLSVGGGRDGWQYGAGTTDSTGLVTIISGNDSSSGPYTPGVTTMAPSVNSSGIVTMSGKDSFQGFLSDDKKTIVGTDTSSGGGVFTLSIFQITGQTYTAGPLPAGIWAAHMLGCGAAPAPFWVHNTITVASGGVMTFSDWVPSNSAVTAPTTTYTGSISSSGTVTIAENPSYHGQMSHDGKFSVGTQTITSGVYSLQVTTK